MVERRVFKSSEGCPICLQGTGIVHKNLGQCDFEEDRARLMTAGIDPNSKNAWKGIIFNAYLAQRAAKSDPDIRKMVKEEIYQIGRPRFGKMVVKSYNRLAQIVGPENILPISKISKRDKNLLS